MTGVRGGGVGGGGTTRSPVFCKSSKSQKDLHVAFGHSRQSWAFRRAFFFFPTGNLDVQVMTPYLSALGPGEQKYRSVWSWEKQNWKRALKEDTLFEQLQSCNTSSLPPAPTPRVCCLIGSRRINPKQLFCFSYFHYVASLLSLCQVLTGRSVLRVFSGVSLHIRI